MTERNDPFAAHYALIKPFIEYAQGVQAMGLERSLVELVKIRASQINGCALCLHMHATEARKQGESDDRILMLDAWQECPLYTARERAALTWTEALTRLTETRVPDEAYDVLVAAFSPEEQMKLTLLINVINDFNRFGVAFRRAPITLPKAA